jgi:hypothetical protein
MNRPAGAPRPSFRDWALLAISVGFVTLTIFLVEAPLLIRICGAVMVGASALLLVMVLTGRVSRRFIRFDPLGITLGETKFEYTVPWDQLTDIDEFEMHDNAVVGFDVSQPEYILVTPDSARDGLYKLLGRNKAWGSREVVIMPSQFATSAEALCAALRTYAGNHEARAGLAPREMGSGTDS